MENMLHGLKTETFFFNAKDKSFELRRHDRDFQVGDILIFREWFNLPGEYSGRQKKKKIINILRYGECPGLKKGYCILGVEDLNNVS
jgi:hypothetical protein